MTPLLRALGPLAALALAGCAAPPPQAPPPVTSATTTAAPSPTSTTSPTPAAGSPTLPPAPSTLPAAADGANLAACADGTCEVLMTRPAAVRLPKNMNARLAVKSIGEGAAVLGFGPTVAGGDFSVGCQPVHCKSRLVAGDGSEPSVVTVPAGVTVTFNKVKVTTVAVVGETAVLRVHY
ncbi:hypothetical protein [Crossiella sp. NPDC003009]